MAQGRGNAKAVLYVVAVFAVLQAVAAKDVVVGGSTQKWDYPPGTNVGYYETWSAAQSLAPGDNLVFEYMVGAHDVQVVSAAEYNGCLMSSGKKYTSGSDTIPLPTAGDYYFLCSFPSHCESGMKLKVTVGGAAATPPVATPPPATPPPATPPPVATPPPATPPPVATPPPATPPPVATPPPATPPTIATPPATPPTIATPPATPPTIATPPATPPTIATPPATPPVRAPAPAPVRVAPVPAPTPVVIEEPTPSPETAPTPVPAGAPVPVPSGATPPPVTAVPPTAPPPPSSAHSLQASLALVASAVAAFALLI